MTKLSVLKHKMEAPDKLYISPLIYETRLYEIPDEDSVEYIRKDALLEWAENWKKLGMSDDFLYAMETLINHMNSM